MNSKKLKTEHIELENGPSGGHELGATTWILRIASVGVAAGSLIWVAAVGFSFLILTASVSINDKLAGSELLWPSLLVAAAGVLLVAVAKILCVTNCRQLGNHTLCMFALLLDGSGIVVPLRLASRQTSPMLMLYAFISVICMLASSILFTYYMRSVATAIGDTKLGSSTRAAIICMLAFVVSAVGHVLTSLVFATTSYGIGNYVSSFFITGAVIAGPSGLLAYIALLVAFALREPLKGKAWKISTLDLSGRPDSDTADNLRN